MDAEQAEPRFQVLDFSELVTEAEPVQVQSAPRDDDDVSMMFLRFKAGDHEPLELVPDLSAGTAGYAIPIAGSAPTPAARYRGGSILPAEASSNGNATPPPQATPPPPTAAPAPVRQRCGTRARSSRGRPVRLRGSRRGRTATATRAGPSGDPDLADESDGDQPPSREGWRR